MYCKYCGAEQSENSRYCTACGKALSAAESAHSPTRGEAGGKKEAVKQPSRLIALVKGCAAVISQKLRWGFRFASTCVKTAASILPPKALLVLLLVPIVGLSFLFVSLRVGGGSSKPQSLIKQYFSAAEKSDTAAILKLMYEPDIECSRILLDTSEDGVLRNTDSFYRLYGTKVTSWKVTKTVTSDDDTLASFNEVLAFRFALADMETHEPSAAVILTVDAQYKDGTMQTLNFLTLKFDSKWYIYAVSS